MILPVDDTRTLSLYFYVNRNKLTVTRSNCGVDLIHRLFVTSLDADINVFITIILFKNLDIWIIILSRESFFSVMRDNSDPKFWKQGEVLQENCLTDLSLIPQLVLRLVFGERNEFCFFDGLLMILTTFPKIFNISQKINLWISLPS